MDGWQAVYQPEPWQDFLGTERHQELKAWLAANGIDPDDVPLGEPITIEPAEAGRYIRYTALLRNAEGRKYLDETIGDAAREERLVPLVAEPPPQWREKENTR